MEINCTLFVQLIHFFIGYLLIRKFFLEPAYTIIENKQLYTSNLMTSIDDYQQMITHRNERKSKSWKEYMRTFWRHTPTVAYKKVRMPSIAHNNHTPITEEKKVSLRMAHTYADMLYDQIRKRYE